MAGRIFKRKLRFWIGYYARRGSRAVEVREPGGKTRAEARKLLNRRLREVAADRIGARRFAGPERERVTVGAMLDEVVKQYKLEGRRWQSQNACHLAPVKKFFGDDRMIDVGHRHVRAYLQQRVAEGFKPATINRETVALKRAFALAVEEGILIVAPKVPHLREDNARQGFFEKAELDRVVAQLADQDLKDFALWSYYTGMRPGESRSLTWAGFDRETWTLRLHSSEAKTGTGRVIAIDGALRAIVGRRIERRVLSCPFIFHRGGKKLVSYTKPWAKACTAVGLGGRRLYDLRRTAVRNMIRAGVPERVAMEISGHRTRQTFDRYNIVSEEDLHAAALRLSDFVDQLPKSCSLGVLDPTS